MNHTHLVTNTYDVFKLFKTSSLCQHFLHTLSSSVFCNPILETTTSLKGKLLHDLNTIIYNQVLYPLLPSIEDSVEEGMPFKVIFDYEANTASFVPVNVRLVTPTKLLALPAKHPYSHTCNFQYIYIKKQNSASPFFILIDINHEITLTYNDTFYNTPKAFLSFCKHYDYEPNKVISSQQFYKKFKNLLGESQTIYHFLPYSSDHIHVAYDVNSGEMFFYTIAYGRRQPHYIIFDYFPKSFYPALVRSNALAMPNHLFNDTYIQPF